MKKFLVIQTAFIGDVILATAVTEHLHKHFPNAQISMLVRAGNESLFQGHPFIHRVHVWNKKSAKYQNLFKLIRTIRAEHFDGVINLQRHTASALITLFSRAVKTTGFDSSVLSFFLIIDSNTNWEKGMSWNMLTKLIAVYSLQHPG